MRRMLTIFGTFAVAAALVAGCGGDDTTGAASGGEPAATTAAPATTQDAGTGGGGGRGGGYGGGGGGASGGQAGSGAVRIADYGAFDSGNLAGGKSFSFAFDQAGTFAYHCKIHRTMTGTVVVT